MENKKYWISRIFSLRNLFVWGNVVLLLVFLLVIAKDNKRGWKQYQSEFKKREIANAKILIENAANDDDLVKAKRLLAAAKASKVEIKQIWNDNIGAVDRCITCHVGYDVLSNVSLTTTYEDHPFRAPADSASLAIHQKHDFTKFGCVTCHGGQGLATEVNAAHGQILHWEQPLLTGVMIQASCVKCHDNADELLIQGKVYPSEILRAKTIFNEQGCIGCHQIGGNGGPISVDLQAETSDKSLSRIDFAYTGLPHDEHTLENWIKLHFIKDPATMVPGDPKGEFNTEPIAPSAMPPYDMTKEDAEALTAFILGLNRKGIRPEYLTLRPENPEPQFADRAKRGRHVYDKFGCAGCHGPEARGGIRNYNYQYDTTPNLRRAASTLTWEEMKEKITKGAPLMARHDPKGPMPPLYMPAWGNKISSDEMNDLIFYLNSIKE